MLTPVAVSGRGAAPDAPVLTPAVATTNPNAVPPAVDVVVNVMIRQSLITAEKVETAHVSRRCVHVVEDTIKLWPNVAIRFAYFGKLQFETPAASRQPGAHLLLLLVLLLLLLLLL
jgi:hypothetical protein